MQVIQNETNVKNIFEALKKIAKANHYLVGLVCEFDDDVGEKVYQMIVDAENSGKISGKVADLMFLVLGQTGYDR